MSVYLDSFKPDGTVVPKSIASKSGKKGRPLFTLKWLEEILYGISLTPLVAEFIVIEYGAYPQSNGGIMYSYLRCEQFIVLYESDAWRRGTSIIV